MLKTSAVEILIPRRFHPSETLVLSMLRRGEISREEFTVQRGNPNSNELPGPDGVHLSCEGSQLQNWKASDKHMQNIP